MTCILPRFVRLNINKAHISDISRPSMATLALFFVIGVVEMFIVTAWTKIVAGNQVMMSGIVTFVNVLIWFYVLEAIISNINNLPLVFLYAFGCALGTMVGTAFIMVPKKKKKTLAPVVQAHERIAAIEHDPVSV